MEHGTTPVRAVGRANGPTLLAGLAARLCRGLDGRESCPVERIEGRFKRVQLDRSGRDRLTLVRSCHIVREAG